MFQTDYLQKVKYHYIIDVGFIHFICTFKQCIFEKVSRVAAIVPPDHRTALH